MSEQQAIERAQEVAREEGWAWADPARATLRKSWLGRRHWWIIHSSTQARGAMARVVLDARTGAVLEKCYVPR